MPKPIPVATLRTSPPRSSSFGLPRGRHSTKAEGRGDALFLGASYSLEEVEFLRGIDAYKTAHRKPMPTWAEVLAVAETLGYRLPGSRLGGRRRAQQFASEMQRYMKDNRRPFPTWAEVLKVLKSLGYAKPEASRVAAT